MLSKSDPMLLPNTTKALRTRNLYHVFFWVLITFYGTSQAYGAYRIFQNKKAVEWRALGTYVNQAVNVNIT